MQITYGACLTILAALCGLYVIITQVRQYRRSKPRYDIDDVLGKGRE